MKIKSWQLGLYLLGVTLISGGAVSFLILDNLRTTTGLSYLEYIQKVKECEKTLPRNQNCNLVLSTKIVNNEEEVLKGE